MNDFLDNLAERAMNVEHGMRPRLPSRFDPAHSTVTWPSLESATREPFEMVMGRETDLAGEPSGSGPAQPGEHPFLSPIRPQKLLHVPPEVPSRAPISGVNASAHDPSPVEYRVAPNSLTPAPQPLLSILADRHDPVGDEKRPVADKSLIRPSLSGVNGHRDAGVQPVEIGSRRDAESKDEQDSILIAPRPRAQPISPADSHRIEIDAIEVRKTETPDSFLAHPKLGRYAEPPSPRRQPKAQPPSPPSTEQVINVTIGRIEVRATPAPPATTRSSNPKPPVMSLDEYLRRRGGKGGGV